MDPSLRRGFRLGEFDVEPLSGCVSGPSGVQHLQPKVMDVLVYLAAHSGELVERDVLLENVWRRITTEEVLTRCISELRRALGDDRGSPRFIQTVPKRGYRLIERIELPVPAREPPASKDDGAPEVHARPPAPSSAMASVAVLPFESLSSDPSYAYLGDAFGAELHSTLARVDRLRVVSRRSSFVFRKMELDVPEIGRRLNVDYVITGSMRCSGRTLRVTAELNDTSSGTQVWAQSYDRTIDDLLAVEREIAEEVVGSFTVHQLRAETFTVRRLPTSSLDAWGLVQKGRALALDFTRAGTDEALDLARRAIDLDAGYPAAQAMLASLLVECLVNGWSRDPAGDERAALAAADKALTLAPRDPFILKMVSLAWSYCRDYRKAMACLHKAVQYAPFDFGAWGYMGWPLTASGEAKDLGELRGILDRLLAVEPQHPGVGFWYYHRSVADVCEGDYEAARAAAETAVELRPNLSLAWMHYAAVLGALRLERPAREALARCSSVNAAMTPEHFRRVVERVTADASVVERRLCGLRAIGA